MKDYSAFDDHDDSDGWWKMTSKWTEDHLLEGRPYCTWSPLFETLESKWCWSCKGITWCDVRKNVQGDIADRVSPRFKRKWPCFNSRETRIDDHVMFQEEGGQEITLQPRKLFSGRQSKREKLKESIVTCILFRKNSKNHHHLYLYIFHTIFIFTRKKHVLKSSHFTWRESGLLSASPNQILSKTVCFPSWSKNFLVIVIRMAMIQIV